MDERDWLAGQFERHRAHLRGVAYRMLGSLSEADDAVQEAWLRSSRADTRDVGNLAGWLTTVVARVALDMLRARKAKSEEPLAPDGLEPAAPGMAAVDPEQEADLADSVGLALLVVLETLAPAERLAFVLHDLFGVPFDEIAGIVGRSPDAARQLASRARRRVQGAPVASDAERSHHRQLVLAFISATRTGDLEALMGLLDPELVVRVEGNSPGAAPTEVRGARVWARSAVMFARTTRFTGPALIDGEPGAVLAPRGRLLRVLRFGFAAGRIARIEVVSDPERLAALDVSVLDA